MHDIRTFRGRTLYDALNFVRRELGEEAVIVQTSRAPGSRFWPWTPRDVVVTACLETQSRLRFDSRN